MKNLRLLFLIGLCVIYCTKNANSTGQASQQPNVSSVEQIVTTALDAPLEQEYAQIDALLSPLVRSSSTSNRQNQVTKKDLINQQDGDGQTPLHSLISSERNVDPRHVVALLKFNPTVLTIARDRTTPLHAAAIRNNPNILQLLVTKILVDTMSDPFNPASSPAISRLSSNAYIKDLETRLSTIFESPINREKSAETLDLLRTRASNIDNARKNIIWECTKLLKAYMYINDYRIDKESFGDFDIHLSFEEAMFKTIIDKDKRNLLQLAGDQQNTRLVSCICSRIYTPWTLRRLSRAPGTKWKDLMSDNLPYNDEIKRTIRTRYWSQLSDVLKTVGLVITGTIGAYLGFLIRQIHHQLSR